MFLKSIRYSISSWKNIPGFLSKHSIIPRVYAGKRTVKFPTINEYLSDRLQNDLPFFYGRIGATEGRLCLHYLRNIYKNKIRFPDGIKEEASINAGFFTNSKSGLVTACKKQLEAVSHLTGMRIWFIRGEKEMLNFSKNKSAKLIYHSPIRRKTKSNIPWQYFLKGKKVLVISSFCKTIKKQYGKREHLFKDERKLPEFSLKTIDAVVSLAGNTPAEYKTWEDALLGMFEKCKKEDFDVALIGAGGYSLPLGDLIFTKLKKKVIVLNSDIQLMFGIYGNRYLKAKWFNQSEINEYWVRPSKEETPKNHQLVDEGSYW